MEGRGKQGDEQAHAAGNEDARRIADQPGKSDAGQRRAVKDQAEWGFLRVGIAEGRSSQLSGHLFQNQIRSHQSPILIDDPHHAIA